MYVTLILSVILLALCTVCNAQAEKAYYFFSDGKLVLRSYSWRVLPCSETLSYLSQCRQSPLEILCVRFDWHYQCSSWGVWYTTCFRQPHLLYSNTQLVWKVSIVMVPENDTLYFFSGLNCCKPIHRVSDVLEWCLKHSSCRDAALLLRVSNCLSYYQATPIDPQGSVPLCECGCKNLHPRGNIPYKKPKRKIITSSK